MGKQFPITKDGTVQWHNVCDHQVANSIHLEISKEREKEKDTRGLIKDERVRL